MKANIIHDITFDTDKTIIAATLSKSNEAVILISSGDVIKFNLDEHKVKHLFSVNSVIPYTDGGFDVSAKTSIYTMDEIVVVVNEFKTHGFVHYPGKYDALHLWRADYHADISAYPIALFKNAEGIPHLIFGNAWNHVQIVNLDTRQVLTASKSLIEEKAEEKHLEFYEEHSEHNKLMWPTPYNYFFGRLFISPDQDKFLSAGWIWGSFDCYNIYDIEEFIKSPRISDISVGAWEHTNRATCWIDNETIAIVHDPYADGEENATEASPSEIHLYKIKENIVKLEKKIQISDKNLRISNIYFQKTNNSFIGVSEKDGLTIISFEGQIIFKDPNLKGGQYNNETGLFIMTNDKTISVYEIVE